MTYEDLKEAFLEFQETHKGRTLSLLGHFFYDMRKDFEKAKMAEWKKEGHSISDAQNKTRQGWVSFLGGALEKVIALSLVDFCKIHDLKLASGRNLRTPQNAEYDLVRRSIMVNFGGYSLLPDADMVIYRYSEKIKKVDITCILSVKNSFRERYTETPYWKLKLKENPNTKAIRVFMITPDNDDEISFTGADGSHRGARQSRIVMEYELDGIYLAKEKFDGSDKVKSINDLQKDILAISR